MAAPSATARGTPSGIKLEDGFSTKITFAGLATLSVWEVSVTPPGVDGGEAISTTTMHNVAYRTKSSRTLKELTDVSTTVAYDPGVYTALIALVNVETTITVTFPDGSTVAFYGFLRSFTPQENTEGGMPTAAMVVTPTNFDPTNRVEAGPTITSVAGT